MSALAGKVALVTGAGRGLGRAFAERLAELGCRVALHGMREHGPAEYGEGTTLTATAAEVAAHTGAETMPVRGDLTVIEEVERVLQAVADRFGHPEILVHNAGGDIGAAGGKPDPNDAVMVGAADVRSVLERNLLSTIFLCQRAARPMMERQQGRIITISSVAAFRGRSGGAIYATAKAGIVQYTRCLADQLRPYNVTANAIAPGDTRTGRFLGTRPVDPARLAEGGTLERIAHIHEVARAVELFAGPMGDFITGQVLRIDGGAQLWPA